MRHIELLAPARTADIGIEAIRHGADAVYIGGPAFGARQAACNSVEDIKRLVAFASPFHVRVYVTINTLLRPEERPIVQELIWQLYDIGVSAIIIQDPAILTMDLPPIPLHASTQMDNRTAKRVAELEQAGFEQVVLARELTTAQIADIHASVPDMPLEVFIHGALCVGLSGRCYASERLYGRSANRGECAQICRLKYNLINENGDILVKDRYLLSLKDMNRSAHIEELIEAGASSFKIEGRLKDVFYVKNITAYYRQIIDNIIRCHPDKYARSSIGEETFYFTPDPTRSFNRGFTSYLTNDDIFQPLTPKSIGQYTGKIKSINHDCLTVDFETTAGDGLCFFDHTQQLQGFRVNRVEGKRIYPRPMPKDISVGISLYRNQDQIFDKILAGNSAERHIPIDLTITDTATGFCLSTGTSTIDVVYKHELARTNQRDNIIKQLSRLGDTPYRANVIVALSNNYFIPSSILAQWRRAIITALDKNNANARPHINRKDNVIPQLSCDPQNILMYCRHCLRRELGICIQGKHPLNQSLPQIAQTDTLYLQLADGHRLRLGFDCRNCQMIVYEK